MKIKCLSCGLQNNLDHKVYDFKGSVKCLHCRTVMEIQTAHGVLIWVNPFSVVAPEYAERTARRDLPGEQHMLRGLQRRTRSQNDM